MVYLTKIYAREVSHREKSSVLKTRHKLKQIYSKHFSMIHKPFFHYENSATQCTNSESLNIRSDLQVL